ncbi:MAG: response regulator [Candidatus Sericytochromatia bacterium]
MPISLLVVTPSYSIRKMLARYLSSADFSVYMADSVQTALPFIEKLKLDAVVCDLDLNEASGLDMLLWLNQKHPAVRPVIMCDADDSDLMELLREQAVSVLQKNRLNLFRFRNMLQSMCQYQRGVTFQFQQISLFELVQLSSRAGQARHVYITSALTSQEGLVCFQNGRVKHAMFDGSNGETAFYEIMKMKQGLFKEMDAVRNEYYTIDSGLDQLMALSALRMDHKTLEIPPTHCTLYSPDMSFAEFVLETYPNAEMELICTDLHEEVFTQLELKSDLLLLDLDMPGLDPRELLDALTQKNIRTRILMMGSEVHPDLNDYLAFPQVDGFYLKPIQYKELGELIHQIYLSQQFSGDLMNLSLFNMLQTFTYLRQPRLLEVTDFFSGDTGQIFIAAGDVQHAIFGELSGRDALKAMLGIRYGLFRQETYWEPVTRSLNVPFTQLMLYLTRYLESNPAPSFLARDLLLQDGRVVTLQPEKINYLMALSREGS